MKNPVLSQKLKSIQLLLLLDVDGVLSDGAIIYTHDGSETKIFNIHETVRQKADWTTSAAGGKGAVREVCEALLKARGKWEKLPEH
jgi:3-deoxy-D-manno-octulosonate 8-phosphate phosphatase KdsC-like HAD superfamily phosphatase